MSPLWFYCSNKTQDNKAASRHTTTTNILHRSSSMGTPAQLNRCLMLCTNWCGSLVRFLDPCTLIFILGWSVVRGQSKSVEGFADRHCGNGHGARYNGASWGVSVSFTVLMLRVEFCSVCHEHRPGPQQTTVALSGPVVSSCALTKLSQDEHD